MRKLIPLSSLDAKYEATYFILLDICGKFLSQLPNKFLGYGQKVLCVVTVAFDLWPPNSKKKKLILDLHQIWRHSLKVFVMFARMGRREEKETDSISNVNIADIVCFIN